MSLSFTFKGINLFKSFAYFNAGLLFVLISLHCCSALVHINSPSNLVKYCQDAPLNLYPRKFNVTAQLALADPIGVCDTIKNPQELVGKIVFIKEGAKMSPFVVNFADPNCSPLSKQTRLYNAGALGMIVYSTADGGPHLGYLYTVGQTSERVQLPAINIAFAPEILTALQNGENVTATIGDTGKIFLLTETYI
jgi:hypothetical protein